MYESPIEMFSVTDYVDQISKKIDEQIEEAVLSAVTKIGVNVNKEELIRALKYDRDQYEKGYEDGKWHGIDWHFYPEEKPITNGDYFVTYLGESGVYAGLVEFVDIAYWTGCRWLKDCDDFENVIAFATLPKPCRRENEE